MSKTAENGTAESARAEALASALAVQEGHGLLEALPGGAAPRTEEPAPETEAETEADPAETAGEPDSEGEAGDESDIEPKEDTPARLGLRALSNAQRAALRFADIPDDAIDALPDKALVALADRLVANEKREKEHFESLKAQTARTEGTQIQEAEEGEPAASPAPSQTAKKPVSRGVPETVREAWGLSEDEVRPVADWHHGEMARLAKSFQADLAARDAENRKAFGEMKRATEQTRNMALNQLVLSVRAGLTAEWPEIVAPSEWPKVEETTFALLPVYVRRGMTPQAALHKAMAEAADHNLGDPVSKSRGKKTPVPEPAARKGPSAATVKPTPKRKLSDKEQTERNAREAMRKHGIVDHGRRRWS